MDTTWTPHRPRWHAKVVRGPFVTGFSFDAVDANDYERLRPGYSEDAVAWLLTTAPRARTGRVADVAAGTGKLTRMLADAGVAAIAVEPSATMRAVLRSVTLVPVIAAIAEALPLANGALACVCVAQAFHHLDLARVVPELHRVVAPGG
jgi:SAM-dependent methyltransferase